MRIIHLSAETDPQAESEHNSHLPDSLSPFVVSIEPYSERTWAVYVNGQLLCVTVYLKGARAVAALLSALWRTCEEKSGI